LTEGSDCLVTFFPRSNSTSRWLLAPVCILAVAAFARAQQSPPPDAMTAEPLYDQEAYDLITLDAKNKNEVLKVEPLKRPFDKKARPGGKLSLRLWDDPQTTYELSWSAVEKIELFEERVLAKAVELSAAGQSDAAYDYFDFLKRDYPKLDGLAAAIDDYLYREAGLRMKQGQNAAALALLRDLHERNSKYANLDRSLGMVSDALIGQYVAKEEFAAARVLTSNLAALFPQHPIAVKWQSQMKEAASKRLAAARAALETGRFREAEEACDDTQRIWPGFPGADATLAEVRKKYLQVRVGVGMLAIPEQLGRRDDWASRRTTRLTCRELTEFVGPGSEGGKYACPVGSVEIDPLNNRLTLDIHSGLRWSEGEASLTGADVAQQLLAMADPMAPEYRMPWADLLADVSVENVYRVRVELRRPHVRPDAFLQTTLPPRVHPELAGRPRLSNGPYFVEASEKNRVVFGLNKAYFAATTTLPKLIVETSFADDRGAIQALRDGRIQAVDRISPWALRDVRSLGNVTVGRYALPLVHCLIPNMDKPLLARRTFRRALVFGIHREAILGHVLGGQSLPRCRVISGPFLQGESYNDPVGYAYDVDIKPRPYEPELAAVLAGVAVEAEAEQKKAAQRANKEGKPAAKVAEKVEAKVEEGEEGSQRRPIALVLVHPPDEIARAACRQIQEQLRVIRINVTLKELTQGAIDRVPPEADLLYAELPMWEPVVDARRILGEDGIAGGGGASMNFALRQLDQASDWRQIRPLLRRIHRIASDEVVPIPLFQLVDHFAHDKSLGGMNADPVSFYENVEQWRLTAPAAEEEAK
jgi:ABC-type transport system substrate-binding protein